MEKVKEQLSMPRCDIEELKGQIEQLKEENQQLKELLKEVRDAWVAYKPYDRYNLCERIDNAIGEKN